MKTKQLAPFLFLLAALVALPGALFAQDMSAGAVQKFQTNMKKAEAGDMKAQFTVGDCYDRGTGVEKNPAAALTWYERSAKQGLTTAQSRYGSRLTKIKTADRLEAYKWLALAAAKGDAVGKKVAPALEQKMTAAELAEARKRVAEFKPVPEKKK